MTVPVAKESKAVAPESYGAVVEQLESVVKRLEDGELSLEDSLREFESGIRLVRRGEKLLGEAEKRVEQLLQGDGEDQVVPLELPVSPSALSPGPPPGPKSAAKRAPADEDDVPF